MIKVSIDKNTNTVTAFDSEPSNSEYSLDIPKAVDVGFGWTYDERNRSFSPPLGMIAQDIAGFSLTSKAKTAVTNALKFLFGPTSPFDQLKERFSP